MTNELFFPFISGKTQLVNSSAIFIVWPRKQLISDSFYSVWWIMWQEKIPFCFVIIARRQKYVCRSKFFTQNWLSGFSTSLLEWIQVLQKIDDVLEHRVLQCEITMKLRVIWFKAVVNGITTWNSTAKMRECLFLTSNVK